MNEALETVKCAGSHKNATQEQNCRESYRYLSPTTISVPKGFQRVESLKEWAPPGSPGNKTERSDLTHESGQANSDSDRVEYPLTAH